MSHRNHGDVHEDGLFDDCVGCADIAAAPMRNADESLLRRWLAAATARERTFVGSENELVAVRNVLNTLERVGRLAESDPDAVLGYLRERWRVDV